MATTFHTTRLRRTLALAAIAATLTAGLTACGDNSKDSAKDAKASDKPAAATTTDSAPTLTAAQQTTCDDLLKASLAMQTLGPASDENGPSDADLTAIADLYTSMATGLSGDEQTAATKVADTINEAVQTTNKALFEDESFMGNVMAPAAAGRTLCGFKSVDFMTHETPAASADKNPELKYMGLPETMPAGTTSLGLTNDADNFHEALVMKVKDSFTGTVEDWTKLDDKAQMGSVDLLGLTVAPPHATTFANVDLTPGRYFVICHVPLMNGEGPDAQPKMGPHGPIWHFTLGMANEVTVN